MSQITENGFALGSLGAQIDAAKEKKLTTSAVVSDRAKGASLGWSSALVRDNREEADREIGKRAISGNEMFAAWAKESEENAAVALEDAGSLILGFDALQQEKQRQALLTKAEKMGVALDRGAAQVRQSLLGFGELLAETGALNALRNAHFDDDMGEYLTPDTSEQAAELDAGIAGELRAKRQKSIQGMPAPLMDSNLFYDVVESAPQMLTQIGVGAAATALGGPVGGSLASMGLMGPMIAGGQYGSLRDEGVSVKNAAKAATANAIAQAPLEALGLNSFFNIFKAKGLKAVGKATGQSMATEYATEFVQHYPEVATDIWARMEERGEEGWGHAFIDRLSQTHREGHHEGLIGAIWGITGGAGRLAYERAHAARAADWRGRMTDFYERFNSTKVKQESPEITQGIIEYVGMDGDAYVDAEEALRLYQSGALDLDILEVSEPQLMEAAAMGQDIPIKAARLVAYAKDKPEFTTLLNMTRDVPYAETVAEIEREGRKQEDIDRVIEVLKEQSAQEEAFTQEVSLLENRIAAAVEETEQLQKEAVTLAGGSAAYAKTEAARIAEFARRNFPDQERRLAFLRKLHVLGEESARLVERLKAPRQEQRVFQAPAQDVDLGKRALAGDRQWLSVQTHEFKEWFADSKVVDENGDPLVVDHVTDAEIAESFFFDKELLGENTVGNASDPSYAATAMVGFWGNSGGNVNIGKNTFKLYYKLENPKRYSSLEALAGDISGFIRFPENIDIDNVSEVELYYNDLAYDKEALRSTANDFVSDLQARGFDGVIVQDEEFGGTSYVAFSPEQIKSVNNRGTFDPNDPRILYQSAFHGSPHRFDKFSLEHIGSGEGAQAYGWGLYFAGDKAIAEWYREELTRPGRTLFRDLTMDGKRYRVSKDGEWTAPDGSPVPDGSDQLYALELVTQYGADEAAGRITLARETLEDIGEAAYAEEFGDEARSLASLDNIERLIRTIPAQEETGQLYEVDIPESSEMLDWDKPISQQSEKVRQSLLDISDEKSIADDIREQAQADFEENGPSFYPQDRFDTALEEAISEGDYGETFGANVWEELAEAAPGLDWNAIRKQLYSGIEAHTGESVYKGLSEKFGSGRAASEHLNSLGIKGIRYLDATSRDAGEGSYNYVVFDDSAIEILNTYYQQRANSAPLGSVTIGRDKYTIIFGRDANLSTLTHETAHIFEEELRRIVASGMADERQTADLASLDKWLARFDDDAALRSEYDSRLKKTYFGGKKFEKLGAEERERARGLAKREYFARGFEAYALEGKAPSEGLRGIFDRFKDWLLAIYKDARALGVDISDEVRGVFDRMLATEMEMEETAAVNELFDLTQAELDKLKVTGPDREYMSGLLTAAQKKAAAEVERERLQGRKERMRQWNKEAREELGKDPVYAARAELRHSGKHLNADAVAASLGPEAVAVLRKSIGPQAVRKEGGQDPKVFAAEHGFADAAHMLTALTEVPGMGARIKEIVAAREALHDAETDPAPYLLKTEEAARRISMAGKYLAEGLGKRAVSDKALAHVATAKLQEMSMGQARSHLTFVGAMRRALKRERAAVARGDFEAALTANTQARLNLEFARQAMNIEEVRQKAENAARRFVKSSKPDAAARYAVNVLAAKYGLMSLDERLAGGKDWNTIAKWYEDRKADGYPLAPDVEMFMAENRPWRELTWKEFADLAEEMNIIATVERNLRKLLTAQGKAEFQERIDGAIKTLAASHTLKKVKRVEGEGAIISGLKKVHALHLKPEVLLLILDGDKALGENWTLIYKPINDAAIRQGQYYKALGERLRGTDMFGAYTEKELSDMAAKKEYVEEIGESVTKEQRIMAALNMGNAGNYQRLKDGFGWTDEQIGVLVRPLDSRDWRLVQSIWNTFEQYKPEAFALQERTTGQRPTEVEAVPFTVVVSDGQRIDLRGGYFPAMYDHAQADPKLQEQFLAGQQPAFAATKKGHLKERTATGAGTALRLDLAAVPRALQDVITDICFREAMIDVGRVLRNREYRAAVESAVGREMYDALAAWLKDAAGTRKPHSPGEGMARWARSSVSVMSMGMKATTILAQPFGITQSIDRLGRGYVMQGLAEAYGQGYGAMLEKAAWVRSVSPFMDNRMKNYDREVADATADLEKIKLDPQGLLDSVTPAGVRRTEKWVRKNAFVPMAAAQFGVDMPTWLGAYAKGLKDFSNDEAKAIEYADQVVRITQGSGEAKDLAQIQRGNEYAKLFTMFYSYFNTLYGMISLRAYDVDRHRDTGSAMRAANSFLLLAAMPAVLTELAAGRGPDEDEEYWKWAAKQLAMYPLQTLIGVRDVSQFIDGKYGYSASPAEDAPASIYTLLKQITDIVADPEKFDAKKLGKITLRAYGYSKGLPLKQAEISAFNVIDYLGGASGDFEMRDLLFTRQKSRR